MPMRPYAVVCSRRDCSAEARYKIAARWSDGVTQELKTYALSCEACLAGQYEASQKKQAACRLAAGEKLEAPGIYDLSRGRRDACLSRRSDLEQQLSPTPPLHELA